MDGNLDTNSKTAAHIHTEFNDDVESDGTAADGGLDA
jgi:hypothetical protein